MADIQPRDADTLVSGIFHNGSTMETQVWLDGRCIGACALGRPREAFQAWLGGIVSRLTPAEIVRVYSRRLIDGADDAR